MATSDLIIAFDYLEIAPARQLLSQLTPDICKIKIGSIMFTRFGPSFVEECIAAGFDIFLDLKFHDIPNTVRLACKSAAELGVWMLNVHCGGGGLMLDAAREGVDQSACQKKPMLIGVTVLTSLNASSLSAIHINQTIDDRVLFFAELAAQKQLDGVVCSAHEAQLIRQDLSHPLTLVVPGIRLPDSPASDQDRITTPDIARANGSDFLVVGRPITEAIRPLEVIGELA